MKITGYRTESYTFRFDRAIGDCNYPAGADGMGGGFLWIDTDEGISGVAPMEAEVESLFRLIEGEDPREVIGLWRRMVDEVHKGGLVLASSTIAAIDIALWDLKAKIAGEPLWRTFGALEGRARAYASGIDYNLSDDELLAFYQRMAASGVDGGKLKIGLDLETDIRRIGVMQQGLSSASDRPQLCIDVNEYWSPKQTVRYMAQIEKHHDITWIEEPARRWDHEGLKLVSQQVKAAVATGENLRTIGEFYPLVQQQAVDILSICATQAGFTGCRQIAHLAHAYELPVSMMNCQANFMAHLAAALPNHISMEVVDPGREHCIRYDSHIEDGFIVLGDSPGLGIEVDEEKLRELQANPPELSGPFPFPRREGAGLYVKGFQPGEVEWS